MGAALIHADRRTDMKKPIRAFRHYVKAPKNQYVSVYPSNTTHKISLLQRTDGHIYQFLIRHYQTVQDSQDVIYNNESDIIQD